MTTSTSTIFDNRIALLATGNELTNGDILNTNSQAIAQQLVEHGIDVGMHLICSDEETDILSALDYLFAAHQAVIITGGLGPTSDDRTRYALAKFIDKDLQFHQPSWDWIVERLQKYNLEVPESNKQQAMFPEGAVVLDNHNGSANGCFYLHHNKLLVMLPGPPRECMPIVKADVLPLLSDNIKKSDSHKLKWRVFGKSEGEFAERMDNMLANYACQTAYRWEYPYIDFKVAVKNLADTDVIQQLVDTTLADDIICPKDQTATEVLQKNLQELDESIVICDLATGGLFESKIHSPDNDSHIKFAMHNDAGAERMIIIEGLEAYWHNQRDEQETSLKLSYLHDGHQHEETYTIPYRHQQVRLYVVEMVAAKINEWLAC